MQGFESLNQRFTVGLPVLSGRRRHVGKFQDSPVSFFRDVHTREYLPGVAVPDSCESVRLGSFCTLAVFVYVRALLPLIAFAGEPILYGRVELFLRVYRELH